MAAREAFAVERGSTLSAGSQRSRPSFLKPEGNQPGLPPPREVGPLLECALLAFFVLTRALHPVIIGAAQVVPEGGGKPVAPYAKITPVLGECFIIFFLGQVICLANGGVQEWKRTWDPAPMKIFAVLGVMYAIGDILEVSALASVSGDAYQVLLQSKLFITALMMWGIKGTQQTRLQWTILATVMVAMCVYMTAGDFKNCSKSAAASGGAVDMDYILGIGMVVLKVVVSCLCAVLADKYMKEYKRDPIYMQLVRLKVSWIIATIIYTFVDGETWDFETRSGPLTGWSGMAFAVCASFTVKGYSTLYLVAILDALLKNIGEALSVIVAYALFVWVFQKKAFNLPTFLMVITVTLAAVVYVDAKGAIEKAKKYDAEHPAA
jgi:UDP-sugar transporter A1/2/3